MEYLDKYKKNYTRINLLELIPVIGESSIIVHGKYKHSSNLEWARFTTIRPYIEMRKTYTICDHLNVKRRILEKWYQLDRCYHNRKFYLIGKPSTYNHYGDIRGCLILNQELGIQPVIFNEEKDDKITQDILSKLYKFPEVYIREKQVNK